MSKPIYPQKPIIVVVGPTASGKSDLAVCLAKKFNGEVISADSRQVYRGMNIGTGKVPLSKNPPSPPSPKLSLALAFSKGGGRSNPLPIPPPQRGGGRREGVKPSGYYGDIAHYLLNVASPKRRFTAAQYKKLAQAAIKKIQRKNKMPIICGGTGFYIRALIDDLPIPPVKPDLKLRAKLEKIATKELYKKLQKLDPRRAKEIDRHNPRRLIRALEIIYATGKAVPPLSISPSTSVIPAKAGIQVLCRPELVSGPGSRVTRLARRACESRREPGMTTNDYTNILFLGIQIPRPKLTQRIKARLQKRLKQGMLAEVKKLRAQGLSWKRLDSFGLEYRWLAKYLQNKIEPRAQAKNFSRSEIKLPGLRVGRNSAPKANSHASKNKWPSGTGVSYQEMVARLQKDIEHYAKRQMTWFSRDERIHWIKNEHQAQNLVKKFLK